jgi:hypothetical protein
LIQTDPDVVRPKPADHGLVPDGLPGKAAKYSNCCKCAHGHVSQELQGCLQLLGLKRSGPYAPSPTEAAKPSACPLPLKIEQIHSPAATVPHNPKFKKSLAPCRSVVPLCLRVSMAWCRLPETATPPAVCPASTPSPLSEDMLPQPSRAALVS